MDSPVKFVSRIQKAGFQIVAVKSIRLTKKEAEGFYAVHAARPFFGELTDFMSSGKVVVLALEAEGAILKWRDTMGATVPPRPRRERFGATLAPASATIAHTVRTLRRRRRLSWGIFSPAPN